MKTGHWNHEFELNPHTAFGFVYFIRNKMNGKKYIGKKQYYSYKGTKRNKESNWKKYTSSSKHLNEDIKNLGMENFEFHILFECDTRGELTYYEANLQHKYDVLLERDLNGERIWYNAQISSIKFIPKIGTKKEAPGSLLNS